MKYDLEERTVKFAESIDKNISEESGKIWKEAQELTLIFTKIISTMEKSKQ